MRSDLCVASIVAMILCASPAGAQGTNPIQQCVTKVRTDNHLTDERMRRMRSGELLQAFGFPHALAERETVTDFCKRLVPLHDADVRRTAAIRNADVEKAAALSRADTAEKALASAAGSWFRQNHALGWGMAVILFSVMFLSACFRWLRKRKKDRKSQLGMRHTGDYSRPPGQRR